MAAWPGAAPAELMPAFPVDIWARRAERLERNIGSAPAKLVVFYTGVVGAPM